MAEIKNVDDFEAKTDKVMALLQGVQELDTLYKIMAILGVEADESIDINNRRVIVRALNNYLNSENVLQDPDIEV